MTQDQERRESDRHTEGIERMIADEQDPKQRAYLIVMHSFNTSLLANTHALQILSRNFDAHVAAFAQHVTAEERLLNRGWGAWKVLAWVLGLVQVAGLGVWIDARAQFASINLAISELVQADAKATARSEANTVLIRRLMELQK